MSFIRDIIDLTTNLSNTYTTSNLPKFIKDIIYAHQIKKVKKLIDKIPNDVIPFDALFDFVRSVYVTNYDYDLKYAKYKDIDILSNSDKVNAYSIHTKFVVNKNNTIAYVDLNQRILGMRKVVDSEYIYALKIRIALIDEKGYSTLYFTNLDKYQEISSNVLHELRRSEYNQTQSEIFSKLQQILIDHIKMYLYENIGVFDSINL